MMVAELTSLNLRTGARRGLVTVAYLVVAAIVITAASGAATVNAQTTPQHAEADFAATATARTATRAFAAPLDAKLAGARHLRRRRAKSSAKRSFSTTRSASTSGPLPSASAAVSGRNAAGAASAVGGEPRLVSLQFLHRHGARTQAAVVGGLPDWNSCTLSAEGRRMALSLGRFLRSRYGVNASQNNDPSLRLIPDEYNFHSNINSVSTEFERTIRTGYGVLLGLYNGTDRASPVPTNLTYGNGTTSPNDQPVLPMIGHTPATSDLMMGYWYTWPSALLRQPWQDAYYQRSEASTRARFSDDDLAALGIFLNATHLCATQPTLCVILAEDTVLAMFANGPSNVTDVPFPDGVGEAASAVDLSAVQPNVLTQEIYNMMPRLVRSYADELFVYYQSNADAAVGNDPSYWANVGYYAQPLTATMMANFDAAMAWVNASSSSSTAGSGGAAPPVVRQFSAHDVTVYGLLVALGAINHTTTDLYLLAPTFTAALMLELYDDGSVAVRYAQCDQRYGTDHAFALYPNITMRCARVATGEIFYADRCTLEELKLGIDLGAREFAGAYAANTRESLLAAGPAADAAVVSEIPGSWCAADPRDVNSTNCSVDHPSNDAAYAAQSPALMNSMCVSYRVSCAELACNATWVQTGGLQPDGAVISSQTLAGTPAASGASGTPVAAVPWLSQRLLDQASFACAPWASTASALSEATFLAALANRAATPNGTGALPAEWINSWFNATYAAYSSVDYANAAAYLAAFMAPGSALNPANLVAPASSGVGSGSGAAEIAGFAFLCGLAAGIFIAATVVRCGAMSPTSTAALSDDLSGTIQDATTSAVEPARGAVVKSGYSTPPNEARTTAITTQGVAITPPPQRHGAGGGHPQVPQRAHGEELATPPPPPRPRLQE